MAQLCPPFDREKEDKYLEKGQISQLSLKNFDPCPLPQLDGQDPSLLSDTYLFFVFLVLVLSDIFVFLSFQAIMTTPPLYCENGTSVLHVWQNRGLTHCFSDTLSTTLLGFMALGPGLAELFMYYRFRSRVPAELLQRKFLFILQLISFAILLVLPVVQTLVLSFELEQSIYGYIWYRCVVETFAWVVMITILEVKRDF